MATILYPVKIQFLSFTLRSFHFFLIRVRYRVEHEKIKFVCTSGHVISSIKKVFCKVNLLYLQKSVLRIGSTNSVFFYDEIQNELAKY